jgi:hypothetical protein
MDIKEDIKWSCEVEDYFKDIGEKCNCMAWLHNKSEVVFSTKSMYIDLPVIIFSTLSGSLSLSASRIFGQANEKLASIVCGLLSIGVGILNTINSYFAYSRKAENSKQCFIQYSKLYRFICIELSLPREERIKPRDLLKMVQEQYERLNEIGNILPMRVIDDFKKKFKNSAVSKPELANGLDEIDIYGRNKIKKTSEANNQTQRGLTFLRRTPPKLLNVVEEKEDSESDIELILKE